MPEGEAFKADKKGDHPKAPFVEQYARVKVIQAATLFEEIIELSDGLPEKLH